MREHVSKNIIISSHSVLGDGFVAEIYFSGCYKHCINCHNEHLKDINYFDLIDIDDYYDYNRHVFKDNLISEIHILGGEPLLNFYRIRWLAILTERIKKDYNKLIVLFTGWKLSELKKQRKTLENLFAYVDYIKTGDYRCSLPERVYKNGYTLASCNQFFVNSDLKPVSF